MSTVTTEKAPPARAPKLPLFYSRPEPITAERFKAKSLAREATAEFARKTNSVPLSVAEFGRAQRDYPIVFTTGDKPRPIAIVGLRQGENLFLDAHGRWAERTYVPAYVRRYPFILMNTGKSKEYALCVDTASGLVRDDASNPFYVNGKPSALIDNVGKFCGQVHAEFVRTEAFCDALTEHKLLDSHGAELTDPAGKKMKLGPFRSVSAKKLAELPDKAVLEFHRKGWLAAAHAHLLSLENWPALAARLGAR